MQFVCLLVENRCESLHMAALQHPFTLRAPFFCPDLLCHSVVQSCCISSFTSYFSTLLFLSNVTLLTKQTYLYQSYSLQVEAVGKARQGSFIYIEHFIHNGNSMCFTVGVGKILYIISHAFKPLALILLSSSRTP